MTLLSLFWEFVVNYGALRARPAHMFKDHGMKVVSGLWLMKILQMFRTASQDLRRAFNVS